MLPRLRSNFNRQIVSHAFTPTGRTDLFDALFGDVELEHVSQIGCPRNLLARLVLVGLRYVLVAQDVRHET